MRRGDSATTRDELLTTPLYEGTAAPPSRKSPYFIVEQSPRFIRALISFKFTL